MGGSTLFRKSSLDSISSPEQLNDYIRVSNPSIWLILAALCLLLAAVLVWGFAGSLPTKISTEGVAADGGVVLYVGTADAQNISVGQKAELKASGGSQLTGLVSKIGAVPMSAAEITSGPGGGYLARKFAQGEFAVEIAVTPDQNDLPAGTLMNVDIVTDSVRPADFLLK
jgi:hypothetical protein